MFRVKTKKSPIVLKTKPSDGAWKENFIFVRRDSINGGDSLPKAWIEKG